MLPRPEFCVSDCWEIRSAEGRNITWTDTAAALAKGLQREGYGEVPTVLLEPLHLKGFLPRGGPTFLFSNFRYGARAKG